MTVLVPEAAPQPLTLLNEEEQMFRDTVRQFAQESVAPRVARMDEAARIDPDLIPQLFELGLMGIEIPDKWGGAASSFNTSVLVVEELSRIENPVVLKHGFGLVRCRVHLNEITVVIDKEDRTRHVPSLGRRRLFGSDAHRTLRGSSRETRG